jgi:hypothetical protein
MCQSSQLTSPSADVMRRQLDLIRWELEKYGPAFNEPPAGQVVDEAMRLFQQHAQDEPFALAVHHGSEILRRRGREALTLAVVGCARVAAFVDPTVPHVGLLHAIVTRSRAEVSMNDPAGAEHFLGMDEVRDMELDMRVPTHPSLDELARDLVACIAILPRPPDWSAAHGLGFVLHAAHVCDRADNAAFPDKIKGFLGQAASVQSVSATADELLARGAQLFAQTGGHRFVVLRAVEDQLMQLSTHPLEFRELLVKVINYVVAEAPMTPLRRAIVTAAMAVLATSPKALQRDRECPPWPV